jgi:hypothetical protein
MDIKNFTDFTEKYTCNLCHIVCSRESEWRRHLLTRKHTKRLNGSILDINGDTKKREHVCSQCHKIYLTHGGLWKHSKICQKADNKEKEEKAIIDFLIKENAEFKNIVLDIMKSNSHLQQQNSDIQKQLLDVCKHSNNTVISNNNNNNNTFNLQFFLNEQCKDAMNISDFANSFDLQLSDLETVGELGYVNGITKIMVDKLNSMDIYKRPIHCSDAKREIIYVKDENVWTKEEKDNPKLRQAIKSVSFRNMKLVYNWSNAYPESKDNESKLNDTYMKLVIESTGGNNPILESENKIIRRIAKEIVIEKMHN